ncbi:CRISPR-associated nuclease/helicase Cas3 [compost metagenome]
MNFYAKSSPPLPDTETIQQHTQALIDRYHQLKTSYASALPLMSDRDWQILYWAVQYHDVGKYDAVFQNKIRSKLNLPPMDTACGYNTRHNYLSVLAMPFKQLGLDKEEEFILAQAVAYHHERDEPPKRQELVDVYKLHILPYREQIEQELGIAIDPECDNAKLNKISLAKRIREGDLFTRYVLIKGLLHRLDHSASAHVPVELGADMHIGDYVHEFLQNKLRTPKNALQQFTERHQQQHVVVVAQTGMGKTEAGLLWLGKDKGFLTLPLRVSINAMYERIIKQNGIGFTRMSLQEEGVEEATGLLHSTSLDYLSHTLEADDEALEKIHSQSREYANKLVISTIDQILKFPFYYLGFEKEYATLASSKVIIDELQAYDPRIAALIIRALVLIDQIGGSFMIMTATLPGFYYKALQSKMKNSRLPIVCDHFIDDTVVRHHVNLREASILDETSKQDILRDGQTYKVLVICNTIARARELYEQLCDRTDSVFLLHARFIKKDRARLERAILQFASGNEAGIWITTQLVEASLDIDFDRMHTEMSTLDSQFQRYGRLNRKGLKPVDQVNIQVYTSNVSGIGGGNRAVYHEDIYNRSLALLSEHQTRILTESEKHRMIDQLYDEQALEGSSFKRLFCLTLKELENRPMYETEKKKAQDLLRDIQEIQAIPECFRGLKEIEDALNIWKSAKGSDSKHVKRKARQQIEQYTVGVNRWLAEEKGLSPFSLIHGLYYVHMEYDDATGLKIGRSSST